MAGGSAQAAVNECWKSMGKEKPRLKKDGEPPPKVSPPAHRLSGAHKTGRAPTQQAAAPGWDSTRRTGAAHETSEQFQLKQLGKR